MGGRRERLVPVGGSGRGVADGKGVDAGPVGADGAGSGQELLSQRPLEQTTLAEQLDALLSRLLNQRLGLLGIEN